MKMKGSYTSRTNWDKDLEVVDSSYSHDFLVDAACLDDDFRCNSVFCLLLTFFFFFWSTGSSTNRTCFKSLNIFLA